MAKQGQHRGDGNDPAQHSGRNNPDQSMEITTGTPKKQETYERQARERRDTDPEPQRAKASDRHDEQREHETDPHRRAREGDITGGRSGSDSNASRRTRG
jgi:hypothetical protein